MSKNKKLKQKQKRQAPVIESLEPRIMMSADLPGLDTLDISPDDPLDVDIDRILAQAEEAFLTAQNDIDDAASESAQELAAVVPAEEPEVLLPSSELPDDIRRELIIVDPSVPDYELLLAGVNAVGGEDTRLNVVVLDPYRSGIEQISEILASRSGLGAIHLISHGTDAAIQIGGDILDLALLQSDPEAISGWGGALSEEGDILIYGCNVAETEEGQVLIDALAEMTRADVAASDDLTGHESLGGDWELEYRAGDIETPVFADTLIQRDWTGVLDGAEVSAEYLASPLAFEENTGQTDESVDFLSRGDGYSVFLTDGDAVIRLGNGDSQHVVKLNLVDANADLSVDGQDELASNSNYLIGNDESNWQTNVNNYANVYYQDVYEGIDLRYYGNQRQLEYDFVVDPGSDPDAIRLSFDGIVGAEITETGELRLILNEQGEATYFKAPISHQTADDGSRIEVTSAYVIHEDGSIGFTLGDYDSSRELVIDPILDYTTFVGGTGYDALQGIAADVDGNVYITGWTASTDFPTTAGAFDPTYGGGSYDIFVAKLSPDGSSLLYSTFIGGSGSDMGNSIAVDSSGNAYVTGQTTSTDFATVNAYQNTLGGTGDAVVLKLNSGGDALLYSSYFGGTSATGSEVGYDLALDDSGIVYVTGQAYSADMPLKNAYDATLGGTYDAFVAKLDLTQSGAASLLYSSLFGGIGGEYAKSIAVDGSGAFTIAGMTDSADLTTLNAYQASYAGGTDAFVTRFNASGSAITYSTYMGGSTGSDWAEAIAVDASGALYVGGKSAGGITTTAGAFDTTFNAGSADGFVAKIDPMLSGAASLAYSTYLGGGGFDYVIGVDVDNSGVAYLTGFANAGFPTTADGYDRVVTGSNDGFFATLSADGGSLTYSTFLGGDGQDRGMDVVWNAATGSAYVGGLSGAATGWSGTTATQGTLGGQDAFVIKYTFNQTPTATADSYSVAEGGTLNGNVISDNTGAGVDSDPDADPLTASLVEGPLHGSLVLNADGSFTYTPHDTAQGTNFADSDSFTYQVSDGKGGTDTATVSITVTPDAINEAPVNSVPGAQITGQDLPLVFSDANGNRILLRDDAGGDVIELTLTATNGMVTLAGTAGLTITGGADGSATLTVQGTLTNLNNAVDGLVFSPTASYLGAASLQIDTNDLGNSGTGGAQSDTDLINIDVIAVNDPPVNTVPAAQTTDLNGIVLFSSATGTALSVSDMDAGGAAIEVTLSATNGTLNLSGTKGLTFSTGDGSADGTMTFTGTVADINAALEGMTFVAAADFTGTAGVQITTNDLGNSGAGGALIDSDSVDITVQAIKTSLWLSTADDVASPGAIGLTSWTAGQVIEFGETGGTLSFEPGTTTGAFSLAAFDLDSNASSDGNTIIDGIEYVTRDMTAGGVALQTGDVLFSTAANETIGGVSYESGDIILFRPTTAGDYSAGTFSLFFDKTDAGIVVEAFTLVESPVMVGDTLLNAGDLLLSEGAKDILRFAPTQLGETTSGTQSVLIDGDGNLGFGKNITAIELVEHTSVIGDRTLQAGTLIVAVDGEDSAVGSGTQIAVSRFDLFTLDVSTTGVGTTSATAELLFEGADVQFDDNKEAIFGVSLMPNQPPAFSDQGLSVDENSANGTVVGTVTGTDPEGGAVTYAIVAGNTDGAFAIDATTGQITVANSTALDYETTPGFTLTVAAIDPGGAYDTATVTVNLNDIEAPVLSGANDLTAIYEDQVSNPGTLVSDLVAGHITDPEGSTLKGIAVIAVDDTHGTWEFTIDGGSNWTAFGAVDASTVRLLDADANTSVRFVPDAGWNGTVTNGITFHAWDQTSGTNGGTADLVNALTVRDEFSAAAYDNQDGTVNWNGNWSETDDDNLATSGNVQITGGELRLDNQDLGSFESITRAVDLSAAVNATLDFDFRITDQVDPTDSVVLEVSSNGGSSWTTLEDFTGLSGPLADSRTYDISAYATADTQIRFRINADLNGNGEEFYVDNVQIAYQTVVNTGGSTAFSASSASSDITVIAYPINNLPGAQTTAEDTPIIFNATNGNLISVTDTPGDTLTVTLSATNGSLTLSQTTGLTFDDGADGSATMTVTGTVDDINAALDGLQYTATADYAGNDTLTLTSQDAELYALEIDADLVGRYEFGSGSPGDDSSPGGTNDATLVGDAVITTDPERGDVLSLDGNGDYAEITGNFGSPANVTLAAWVNLTAADSQGADVINLGDNVGIRLDNPNGGSGVWAYYFDGTSWNNIASGQFVAGEGWVHVAYAFDDAGDTHTIYINGTAINSEAAVSSISYANAPNTRIGSHANGDTNYDFNGLIDDARVYARALTTSEIEALANAPVQSSDSDSVAINVTAVNDDPTNAGSMPTDLVFLQDTQGKLDLSALDLSDVDAGSGNLTLTITSDSGHLQTLGWPGVTLGGSQSQLILTGSLADLNDFLNDTSSIDYEHATPGMSGNDVDLITIEISDNGNTGTGGGSTLTLGTINIDIDPVAPQIDLDANDSTDTGVDFTTTWTEGGGQITVADNDATVIDADSATLQSLTITLTNHIDGADERMVADTSGTGISVTYAMGPGKYYVYLTGADTLANYEQVLKSVVYDNTATNPDDTTRVVTVQASDGTNVSSIAMTTINMSVTNVSPTIASDGGGDTASINVAENTTAVTTVTVNDPDGGTPVYTLISGADQSKFAINSSTGELTFQSAPDFENPTDANLDNVYEVVVLVSDGAGGTDTQVISVTVTNSNEAPVLDNSGIMTLTTITEDDTSNNGNLVSEIIASAGGDRITDADSGALEGIAITSYDASNGTWQYNTGSGWTDVGTVSFNESLLLGADDRIRFVPDGANADTAFITFSAWDQTSGTAGTKVDTNSYGGTTAFSSMLETAVISVTAVNDAPNAVNDSATVYEGDEVTIDLAANDSDPDSSVDLNSIVITSSPANGNVVVNGDGTVTYIHDGSNTVSDSFSYTIDDTSGATSNTATVTLTVTPTLDQARSVSENTAVVATLNGNDSDSHVYQIVGGADAALFGFGGNPLAPSSTLYFLSPPDYENPVDDDTDGVYEVIVNVDGTYYNYAVTVTNVNDAPTVEGVIADQTLAEDFASYTIDLNAAFADVETADGALVYGVSGNTNINVSIASGIATITPTADWNGSESLTFTATDAGGLSVSQVVGFAVTAVADIADDAAVAVVEDTATIITVLGNDSFEGTPVVTATSTPGNGAVVINGDNTITYTPNSNYTGADSFTYTVTSGGVSETATVSVNVTAVNDAPTVEGVIADQTLAEDFASYTIDLNAAFADVETADGALVYGVSGNTNINVSIASGIATITPTADWNGSESLTFTATDAGGLSVSQVVGFAVTAVADIADDAAVAVVEDTATIITVLGNDSFEGTPVVTATSTPGNGAVVINGDNTITYTPNSNYTGADSFTYTVTSGGVSETATVSVNVTAVNDAPTVEGVIADQTLAEDFASYTIDLNAAFADVETADGALVYGVSGNTNINVSIASGIATITPTADWNGSESLTFTATDAGGLSVSQVVGFAVTAVADIADDAAVAVVEDTATIITVLGNDSFEGTPVVTATSTPGNGAVVINGDNTITYTPNSNYTGADSFTYTVTSGGVSETATVSVNVTAVNDAPTVEGVIADQTLAEDFASYTIDLNAAFADVETADGALVYGVSGNTNINVSIASGIATITPTADWNGSESLTFTATDAGGLSVSQVVGFAVTAVADIADDAAVAVVEDTATIITVLGNDSFEGTPVVTATSTPGNGAVVINGDNTITYTPNSNYTGADSFTYTVTSGGVSETATVSVNVTAVNDAPTVEGVIADQTLAEDFASYTIDLNAAFADVETADGALVYGVSGNTNINVSIASGIATITPTADWNGSESLTFTATDAGGLSVSQVVGFAVTAVADIADDAAVAVVEDTATIITVLGNDSFEGTPVVTATSTPGNGAVVINGDNTITYTPNSNYTGADSFTYTVTSGGVSETATVSVNVTAVNDAPTVEGVIADQTLAEDFASYTIDLNAAFADVETADGALVYGVSGNTNINVSIASGIATITPTADWNGSESLTFTATDAGGLSVSQVVGFAVTAVADIADDAAVAVVEDTATIITVLGNDSFEGTPVVTATSTPGNGAVVINGDNTITYTPNSNYTGADSFTYTVTSGGVSETATVSVNVTAVNDAPTVEGVIADQTLAEDFASYTIDLNAAFADVETADGALVYGVSGNTNINVSIASGIATITPTADWNGSESLTFTATDAGGLSVSQVVGFAVTAVADIADDAAVAVVEDTATIITVLGNDSFEGTPVVTATSSPGNGAVVINGDNTITYTPNSNYTGADSFTYTVTSGGVSETATVSVNVTAVNDAPTVEGVIADQTLAEDFASYTIDLNAAFADVETADGALVYGVSGNTNINVSIASGIATITPTADWNGSESLTFTATDAGGLSVSQVVGFAVTAVADIADDAAVAVVEDTATIITVLGNDSFEGTPVVTATSTPGNGAVVINGDNTITYTPNSNYTGADSFTYTVTSGGVSETATVSVNVTAVNDAPTVEGVIADQTLAEDFASYTIDLNAAFADVETADGALVYGVSGNTNINVSIASGIATITPTADWNGSESLTFTATDAGGLSVSQVVGFAVTAVADIADDAAVAVVEDTATIITVLGNDSFEGTPVVTATSTPGNGAVVINGDNTITYTPNSNYTGADSFTYTVTSGGVSETATVSVNVTAVNDAPTVEGVIADQTLAEDFASYTIDLNAAFADVETADGALVYGVSGNTNINVSIASGIATITPTADWNGSESLTFTATDAGGLSVSQVVGFAVTAVADIADDAAVAVVEDTATIITVLGNDSFEGTPVVTATSTPGNGAVVINGDNTITYTPNSNYTGADSFTYTVTSGGVSETATVSVNVTAVNDAPTVEGVIADQTLAEDFASYTIDLNAAFADVETADGALVYGVSGNTNINVSIASGIATITPTADWNGSESLTFTATDAGGLSVSQVVGFAVTAVADIADDAAVAVVEDTATIITVLGNDSFEGTPVVTATSTPGNGAVVINGDNTITYTPNSNYTGADSFTYTVTSGGVSETATVSVNVTAVNDAPTVEGVIADQTLAEDFASYTIDLNAAFADVETADGALVYGVSGNTNINVSIASGIATITPTADWNGSESLTFTATDAGGLSVSQVVGFAVTAVADIADDAAVAVVEDTATIITVLGNDSFEGTPVVTATSTPGNGAVVINGDNTITYTPNSNYTGADSFTYTVTSGGVSETATVSVNVTAVNDAPTVEGVIADQTLAEDFASYTIDLNAAFADVETADGALVYGVSGNTNINVSIASGIATITPTADWNGSESLTFTATDAGGLSVSQVVGFAVTAVADIADDAAVAVVEDTATIITVLGNDSFEGTPVVTATSTPGNGAVVINGDNTITYTPNSNYTGADSFTYTVTSGGVSETATVSVNVTAVNDAPTVEGVIADQTLAEDFASYTIDLNAAFADVETADGALVYGVSGNTNINVSIASGIATITPTADWNGSESLTFTATDAGGLSVSQVVGFAVTAVADIADDAAVAVVEDTATIITVLGNDSFEGTPVVTATSTPGNGAVVINGDNTITYTPNSNYTGADSFTYTVTSGGVSETATVSVNVTAVNDAPTVEGVIADQTLAEDFASYTIDLNAAFADVETADGALVYGVSGNTNINVSIASGIATITPTADWNGSESLTFTATDAGGLSVSQVVGFAVTAVADIADDAAVAVVEDTATIITVLGNDSFEGTPVVTATSTPGNGAVVINGDNTITYTPNSNYTGADSFTYTVTSGGVTETATVSLNVTPVNDAPTIGGVDMGVVIEDTDPDLDTLLETAGALTINDPDAGESAFVAGTVTGSQGYLIIDAAGNWDYVADNTQAAIQQLDAGESVNDILTVTTADGTTHNITVTINGAEDAPVIGGSTSAAVTEDGTLTATGALTITDADASDNPIGFPDEASTPGDNGYGDFELIAGNWSYALDNAHAAVQALGAGASLTDSHTFTASDGSTQVVSIVIAGAAEAAPPPVVEPPVPEPEPEPIQRITPPSETEDPVEPPAEEDPALESAPFTGATDPSTAEPETRDPPASAMSSRFPEPLEPDEIFLEILNDSRPNDVQTVKQPAVVAKPTPETAQTFLQELKSFWKEDSTTASIEMSEVHLSKEFWNGLDKMAQDLDESVEEQERKTQLSAEAAAGVGISLTAGFVSWALRAGSMAASFLAAMPTWRHFDPMPVLAADDKKKQAPASTDDADEETREMEKNERIDRLFGEE